MDFASYVDMWWVAHCVTQKPMLLWRYVTEYNMVLTSAERQKRYRAKRNELARIALANSAPIQDAAALSTNGLTKKQLADRETVRASSLLPMRAKNEGPRFMGLSCNAWRSAPDELVDYFGMREAREGWKLEWKEHLRQVEDTRLRAIGIVSMAGNTSGSRALKSYRDQGAASLRAGPKSVLIPSRLRDSGLPHERE